MSPSTQSYILPDLLTICSFKFSSNPDYARARAESSTWLESFNLISDPGVRVFIHDSDIELLCVYCFPYANYEALRLCCDFLNLFFALDEISDEQSGLGVNETAKKYMDAMLDKPTDGSELFRITKE